MAAVPPIVCPKCNKGFKGNPKLYGKRIRCRACDNAFVVRPPMPGEEEDKKQMLRKEEKAPPIPAPAQASIPLEEEEDDADSNPYGITTLDITPRCPNCANEMESADAIVCLFCGYNTMTRTWGKTEKVYETTWGDQLWWLAPGIFCLFLIIFQIVAAVYYCVVWPTSVMGDGWWEWTAHESLRMWVVVSGLFEMWALGYFCYSRFIMHPTPPEKKKE